MCTKSVAERLQIKGDRRLAVIAAPAGLDAVIGATAARANPGDADIALLFVTDRPGFESRIAAVLAALRDDAILWIAYPN